MDIKRVKKATVLYPVAVAARMLDIPQQRVHYMMRNGTVMAYFRMRKNGELQRSPLVNVDEVEQKFKIKNA